MQACKGTLSDKYDSLRSYDEEQMQIIQKAQLSVPYALTFQSVVPNMYTTVYFIGFNRCKGVQSILECQPKCII